MITRVPGGVWLGLSLMAGTAIAACAAAGVPRDISGVYAATEFHAKIQVVGGGELPLTEAGGAAYARNMAGLKDDYLFNLIQKGGAAVGKSPLIPPFGSQLKDGDIRDVIAFLRSLAK